MTDIPQPDSTDDLDQALHEASRLTEDGEWEAAFRVLMGVEDRFPDDATLLCMLGTVAREVEARGMAYDYFRRALSAQPTDPYVLVALGTGLAHYDDPEAETALRLAAVSAPELALTRLHYGAYLAREGLFDLALRELRAAQELEPDDAAVARELGIALLLSGDRPAAAEHLERATGLAPEDAGTRLLLGLALVGVRQMSQAAEELHRASVELLEDGEVQLLAALACAGQGWLDEAWNALARAEAAEEAPDAELLREVEEVLEAEPATADALLLDTVAPAVLRQRLQERD